MEFLEFDPTSDFKILLAIPLIPLVGYVIQIFFGRFLPRKGDWLLTGGLFVTMCLILYMVAKAIYAAYEGEPFFHESVDHGISWAWFFQSALPADSSLNLNAGILFDPIGAGMLAVVGVVSFCVHLFSIGYMKGDRRYHIFFANISLFTTAMLILVLSDNILFLFIFWEVMGLMSYLLIGHFSHDPDHPRQLFATKACKKAFMTTRIGDVLLLIGIILFYNHFHTFNFTELWAATTEAVKSNPEGWGGENSWMTWAGLCILGGTIGKSAQFPLHIWLPDAMEGPTGVSAMIHAATMVSAGVFLLGRCYPLFSPDALVYVTAFGAFTAIFAATIGMTVYDIKGVLAYSTISQLGFMVAAVGCGGLGVVAGMFHMVTHGFFKGGLFLCSGAVIHGCHHEQDMRKMGGLWRKMPITFVCMTICTLAIAGIPLFAGFYSKDKIIQAAMMAGEMTPSWAVTFASWALPAAAAITAFYMFRLIFMTFAGKTRDHHVEEHAQEPPWTITTSISILAVAALFSGHFYLGGDLLASHGTWFDQVAFEQLADGHSNYTSLAAFYPGIELQSSYVMAGADVAHVGEVAHHAHGSALTTSLIVAMAGILLAAIIYLWRLIDPAKITGALGPVYRTVYHKYYIDEFAEATFIKGSVAMSKLLKWFDENIIDGLVNLVGRVNKTAGFFAAWFDKTFVDGAVNGAAALSQAFGAAFRTLQTGRIQQYASFAIGGALIAAVWLILSS